MQEAVAVVSFFGDLGIPTEVVLKRRAVMHACLVRKFGIERIGGEARR